MIRDFAFSPNSNPMAQRKENKGIGLASPKSTNPKTPFQSPINSKTHIKCSPPAKRTALTVKVTTSQNLNGRVSPRKSSLLQKPTTFGLRKQGCLRNHKSVQPHLGQKQTKKKVRFNLEQSNTIARLGSVQKNVETPCYSRDTKEPSKSALVPSVRPIDRRDPSARQRVRIFQQRDNFSPRPLESLQVPKPGKVINTMGVTGRTQLRDVSSGDTII